MGSGSLASPVGLPLLRCVASISARGLVASFVVTLLVPAYAAAQAESGLRLNASAGAGSMVSTDQRGWLGFDQVAASAAFTAGYDLARPLSVEGRLSGAMFLGSNHEEGGLAELGAGARLDIEGPFGVVTWGPSAHLSAAWTGNDLLPAIDLGLRALLRVHSSVAIGPEIVYGQVFWSDAAGYSTDARFWMLSLSLGWRSAAKRPPENDPTAVQGWAAVHERAIERNRMIERERTDDRDGTVRMVVQPGSDPIDRFLVAPPPTPVTDEVVSTIDSLLDRALPVSHRHEHTLMPPVLFAFDSTAVIPCGEVALYLARDAIVAIDDEIVIEGHADGVGSEDYNGQLSERRASWVGAWLVAHGVPPERLRIESHGERAPLAPEFGTTGRSISARQLNRRVTFRVRRVDDAWRSNAAVPTAITEGREIDRATCPITNHAGGAP